VQAEPNRGLANDFNKVPSCNNLSGRVFAVDVRSFGSLG
jgi:hypothetical protein